MKVETPCQEWPGQRFPRGYGQVPVGDRTQGEQYAHRHAWAEANGPIPPGMDILHRCDNPPCTNLDHLWLGTQGDNMRDCAAKGRHNSHLHPEIRQGERNPNALLTDEAVRLIRRRYRRGTGPVNRGNSAALAEEFGVSVALIRKVASRRMWRHVA